jgi:hypothetical protein
LQGVLNPNEAVNEATSYQFAYRESPSECLTGGFIKETSSSYSARTTRRETVIGYLEGLQPNTTYTACLITWNSAFETVIGNPVTFTTHEAYALSVFVSGEGEVSSTPEGICTQQGPPFCSNYFYGPVALTETPKPGYVFAGWIGCAYLAAPPDSCEVDVTSRIEVAAVFLKEGTEGKEGKEGSEGKPGKEGAGKVGAQGTEGAAGKEGPTGKEGATGKEGPTGKEGATGKEGPTGKEGVAGKEGPAGKVEIVTCTKSGKKKKCTTKTVSGTVTFTTSSARATLSRHGVVYATGAASDTRGRMSLRLSSVRKLAPGRYTLTLISGNGSHERIRSQSFTLS